MEAGYACDVAAPEVRDYQLVLHEVPPGWHITRESPGYTFAADVAFAAIDPDAYDGILISGARPPTTSRKTEATPATSRRAGAATGGWARRADRTSMGQRVTG